MRYPIYKSQMRTKRCWNMHSYITSPYIYIHTYIYIYTYIWPTHVGVHIPAPFFSHLGMDHGLFTTSPKDQNLRVERVCLKISTAALDWCTPKSANHNLPSFKLPNFGSDTQIQVDSNSPDLRTIPSPEGSPQAVLDVKLGTQAAGCSLDQGT